MVRIDVVLENDITVGPRAYHPFSPGGRILPLRPRRLFQSPISCYYKQKPAETQGFGRRAPGSYPGYWPRFFQISS